MKNEQDMSNFVFSTYFMWTPRGGFRTFFPRGRFRTCSSFRLACGRNQKPHSLDVNRCIGRVTYSELGRAVQAARQPPAPMSAQLFDLLREGKGGQEYAGDATAGRQW